MNRSSQGSTGCEASRQEPEPGGALPVKPPSVGRRRVVHSSALFGDESSELAIEHNGDIYCLRRTSKGKLILTK